MTATALDVTQLRDTVHGLTYRQIALAIAASSVPDVCPVGVVEDPAVFLAEGLDLVGVAEIDRRAEEVQRLVDRQYLDPDRAVRRQAAAAHRALWGGRRRFQRAHALAGRYWRRSGTTPPP